MSRQPEDPAVDNGDDTDDDTEQDPTADTESEDEEEDEDNDPQDFLVLSWKFSKYLNGSKKKTNLLLYSPAWQ